MKATQGASSKGPRIRMSGRGVEPKGGSIHDGLAVLTGLTVLESTLALLLLVLQNTVPRDSRDCLMVLAVSAVVAVVAVPVVTATPLKLNPPFSDILTEIEAVIITTVNSAGAKVCNNCSFHYLNPSASTLTSA